MTRMSPDDLSPQQPAATPPAIPPKARGGTALFALILAVLALGATGYAGWQQWQANHRGNAELDTELRLLNDHTARLSNENTRLRQRLDDADLVNRSLREDLLGQGERLRNLEDAVTRLAEKSLSSHDTMLLDEAEGLLRMGEQRYRLFHDALGAAQAYALAGQALAGLDDGAFSSLKQSVEAEREALANSQAASLLAMLNTIDNVRGQVAKLPLKSSELAAMPAQRGVLGRLSQVLSGLISIRHEDGERLPLADGRLTRELLLLDLAQTQSALLANDQMSATTALQRVDQALAEQFDDSIQAVQQARGSLAKLSNQLKPVAPVQLGAALAELRNLRAVRALKKPAPQGGKP